MNYTILLAILALSTGEVFAAGKIVASRTETRGDTQKIITISEEGEVVSSVTRDDETNSVRVGILDADTKTVYKSMAVTVAHYNDFKMPAACKDAKSKIIYTAMKSAFAAECNGKRLVSSSEEMEFQVELRRPLDHYSAF